jgi:hypothetical protein
MAIIVGGKVHDSTSPLAHESVASAAEVTKQSAKREKPPSFLFFRILLVVFGVGASVEGGQIMHAAQNAMNEIVAFLSFVIAAMFFCSAVLLEAICALLKRTR